jgi:asparagine synthetase B (glutamine-hydrolysing)
LLVSPSIDVLIRQPQVSAELNRAALADFFLDRFPKLEETFFGAVKRVPPGHVLRVERDSTRTARYWDPSPNGKVQWLTPEEVERFDELLDQAVSRCLGFGKAGIFLSGGLDSVSVAAVVAQSIKAENHPQPWALSLIFPEPDTEETIQRGVAMQLGLSQVLKPFFEAIGGNELLSPALELSRALPAPLLNTWWPAYYGLAREGEERGCRVILTGNGGDEWLTLTPKLAADLWRSFDVASVYRLWRALQRSYRRPSLALLRGVLWTFGAGPVLVPLAHRLVKRIAPWALDARRRIFAPPPKWLAPDPDLRRELEFRWNERRTPERQPSGSFYIDELKTGLDHSLVSWEMEELFNFGERMGMRILHPFWDADLVDLLYRTPPFQLLQDGRTKGLVRASLARRFPDLGFKQQRKLEATNFYSSLVYQEGRECLQRLGGARTLARLGILDEKAVGCLFERLLARRKLGDAHRAWSFLNLESWARAHS